MLLDRWKATNEKLLTIWSFMKIKDAPKNEKKF